jgi:hypothetical protein
MSIESLPEGKVRLTVSLEQGDIPLIVSPSIAERFHHNKTVGRKEMNITLSNRQAQLNGDLLKHHRTTCERSSCVVGDGIRHSRFLSRSRSRSCSRRSRLRSARVGSGSLQGNALKRHVNKEILYTIRAMRGSGLTKRHALVVPLAIRILHGTGFFDSLKRLGKRALAYLRSPEMAQIETMILDKLQNNVSNKTFQEVLPIVRKLIGRNAMLGGAGWGSFWRGFKKGFRQVMNVGLPILKLHPKTAVIAETIDQIRKPLGMSVRKSRRRQTSRARGRSGLIYLPRERHGKSGLMYLPHEQRGGRATSRSRRRSHRSRR